MKKRESNFTFKKAVLKMGTS